MEEGMILGTALNILTTLQTLHLHYRMTVELNNLVVSLWKQELAYVKKTTKYAQSLAVPLNSPLLVFRQSSQDTPHRSRHCLLK